MKKVLLLILGAWLFFNKTGAQNSDVVVEVQSPAVLADINFQKDDFINWTNHYTNFLDSLLSSSKKENYSYIIEVIFHPLQGPTINLHSSLNLPEKERDNFHKILLSKSYPSSFISDFVVVFKINPDKTIKYNPDYIPYMTRIIQDFSELNLKQKDSSLSAWAKNEVLPVLSEFAAYSDADFGGIRETALMVKKSLENDSFKISDLTDRNFYYWRGVIEMQPGNMLMQTIKTFLYSAEGKHELALRHAHLLKLFSEKNNISYYYLDLLSIKGSELLSDINNILIQSDSLNNRDKNQEAIMLIDSSLANFPGSSSLGFKLYELYADKENSEKEQKWKELSPDIFANDFLFQKEPYPKSQRDSVLRSSLEFLFRDKEKIDEDLIRYANIAFSLEQYSFAAEVYWNIYNFIPKEKWMGQNIPVYFFYCLDKLGEKKLRLNFNFDYQKEFRKINSSIKDQNKK